MNRKHSNVVFFAVLALVVIFTWIMYGSVAVNGISNKVQSPYLSTDDEAGYLITTCIRNGCGWYKDFSIVYPPGKFLTLTTLFLIFQPGIPLMRQYTKFIQQFFFPVIFFILSYHAVKLMFADSSNNRHIYLTYFFSLIAVALYLLFVHAAQEIHILIAAFFIILLHQRTNTYHQFFAGLFLGLIFLFRVDAGILMILSFIPQFILKQIELKSKHFRFFIIGFLSIWLPVLVVILVHGSMYHFIYDTFYLGLVIQPKVMNLPIPPNALGKVFFASLTLLSGLVFSFMNFRQDKHNPFITTLAIFGLLSFVSALGRSDEDHLWYGIIWLPLLLVLFMASVLVYHPKMTRKYCMQFGLIMAGLLFFSYLMLQIKSTFLFLFSVIMLAVLFRSSRFFSSAVAGLAGIIGCLIIFHSPAYLTLRLKKPALSIEPIRFLQRENIPKGIAGMYFSADSMQSLQTVKAMIRYDNPYVFIFPDHVILHEFFRSSSPTRYLYLTGERTDFTENEIIYDLENKNVKQFIIFPEKANMVHGKVWDWIMLQTRIEYSTIFEGKVMEYRKKLSH